MITIRRIVIAVVIAVIIVPTVLVALFISEFDPNQYGPALAAAVAKATGRQLIIGGPIKISLSLNPEISADNVSLVNPPGFTDPDLLTIHRLQARIALLPLLVHRLNIIKLIVLRPAVILETTNTGAADWDLTPPSSPAMSAAGAPGPHLSDYKMALEAVEIQDGSIITRPAHSPNPITIALASVTGTAASSSSPLNLHAQASFDGVPIDLNGVVGPVARFSGAGSGPWQIDLTLSSSIATANVDGSVSAPRKFSGYDLSVKFAVPALETVVDALPRGLLVKAELPPLHGVVGSAEVVDQNAPIPAINHLTIKAGASDLSSFRPGLTLTGLDIEVPSLAQPISVNATGAIGTVPLSLAAHFGPASVFINPAWLPSIANPSPPNFPVSIKVQAGNDSLDMEGGIATPMTLSGAALNVNISVPDLSKLSPLAGTALPGWKNIAAQGSLTDPGGLGLMNAIGVDSLVFTMDNAALGGDLGWYFGNHQRLQIALRAQQINLDAVLAPSPGTPATPVVPPVPVSAVQQADATVPQFELPVATLKNASADIQLAADRLVFNQATYTALQGHAVLANGVLKINPVTAVLPGGGVTANATVDATKDPAAATLTIDAPALALSPFLKALSLPSDAEGTVQAGLSVAGTGNSLQDLSRSMNGQLGMAMVQGTVDGAVLSRLFGTALSAVDLPASLVGAQGPVAVRCFGLRVDAQNGIGQISTLTLDSSRLLVQGGGSLNFGDQTLGIILRPQIRVAGNAIGIPVEIGGTFSDPTASVAPLAAVQGAAKTAVGLTESLAEDVPGASRLLGKIDNKFGSASTGDVCPAALSLARLGKPGPAAPPESAAASAGADGAAPNTGPKTLLNALFGK